MKKGIYKYKDLKNDKVYNSDLNIDKNARYKAHLRASTHNKKRGD